MEKLEWCCYPTVKKFDDMFSRFDRIPACDGQTRTDDIFRQSALCIASHGKKLANMFIRFDTVHERDRHPD